MFSHTSGAYLYDEEGLLGPTAPQAEGDDAWPPSSRSARTAPGKFRFHLKAPNGEIIAASQGNESKASAEKGIEAIKTHSITANVEDGRSLRSRDRRALGLGFRIPADEVLWPVGRGPSVGGLADSSGKRSPREIRTMLRPVEYLGRIWGSGDLGDYISRIGETSSRREPQLLRSAYPIGHVGHEPLI
jgi:hypothetical protein